MACESMDERCDQFSFGVCLWEMLARATPWPGLSGPQVMFAVAVQKERLAIPHTTPPRLAALIQRLWAHAASNRPPFLSVRATLAEIRDEAEAEATQP